MNQRLVPNVPRRTAKLYAHPQLQGMWILAAVYTDRLGHTTRTEYVFPNLPAAQLAARKYARRGHLPTHSEGQ